MAAVSRLLRGPRRASLAATTATSREGMGKSENRTATQTPICESADARGERPNEGGTRHGHGRSTAVETTNRPPQVMSANLKKLLLSASARTDSLIPPRPRFSRRAPLCMDDSGAFVGAKLPTDVPPGSRTRGQDR